MSEIGAAHPNDPVAFDRDDKIRFPRVIVGGLPVAVLDRDRTARLTIGAAMARRGSGRPCLFFTTVNGQVVSLCASSADVRRLFLDADVISPDGMSVVLASRLHSRTLPERVATTDAFHDAARVACGTGATFYFLGATEEVNALAAERASALHPGLRIVGRRNGYFGPDDVSTVVEDINAAAPDVLWIGLGVPGQQRFVIQNRHRLTAVGVAKSCGGLFDFLAGRAKRAPDWMQTAGLEWAYRAYLEPKRLAWRYLTTNPHAFYHLLASSRGDAKDGAIEASAIV
jgi:exopolysaccharide biosynthesis WecB/TagA/CpsF family protein